MMMKPIMSANYDDPESESEEWENELVRLLPDSVWPKPSQKIVVLSNASISCTPNDPDDCRGVLIAELWDSSICLATLFKNRPSQPMKLVWRMDQNVNLANRGNHPMTLSLMVKSVSI